MLVFRLFGYLAAIFSFVLLVVDGSRSIAAGTIVLMPIADTLQIFAPYITGLVSQNGSLMADALSWLQPLPTKQLTFPASMTLVGLTLAIFLIDRGFRQLFVQIRHARRQAELRASFE